MPENSDSCGEVLSIDDIDVDNAKVFRTCDFRLDEYRHNGNGYNTIIPQTRERCERIEKHKERIQNGLTQQNVIPV